jgi:Beta protein
MGRAGASPSLVTKKIDLKESRMLQVDIANYCPALRWKKGEYEALAALDETVKERLLPHIILPPMSERDVEKNRKLSREEFSPVQVGRLSTHWGRRACLLDTRFVQFVNGHVADGERLAAFLSKATELGCSIIPVFDLRTNEYRLKALQRHWLDKQSGLALRLSLSDLGRSKLASEVYEKLTKRD